MVGVPRSQGCRNCRRKKKGCDLQKPICGQCARLNLPCGWDDKRWTFVSQEPVAAAELSRVQVRSRSIPDLRSEESRVTPPTGSQERSLKRTAFQATVVADFWDRFLPKSEGDMNPVLDSTGESWIGLTAGYWAPTVRTLADFDETVSIALNACAVTVLGRVNADQGLLQEGTRLYGKALRETNKALQDSSRAQSDAVLAACKILSTYEHFRINPSGGVSSQAHDWHKHIEGTCRIVELRGPEKHVSYHGHNLFEEARLSAAISGITLRRSNFFTSVAWHTVPWETSPRNLRDELCDIMISFPDLLSKQDALMAKLKHLESHQDRFAVLTEGQQHINRCILVATSLNQWESKALNACLDRSSRSPNSYAGPLTLLEVCRNFNYGFFHVVMIYWAACVNLYGNTWVASRNVDLASRSSSIPTTMRLPEIPAWLTPRPMASNIAKCASHYYRPEAGFWGPQAAGFPIGSALHYYAATGGYESEEMQQLTRLFSQRNLGRITGEFLRSMANTPNTKKGDPYDRQQHKSMAGDWYGTNVLSRNDSPMSMGIVGSNR